MRGENLSGAEAANFLGCLLNPIATDEQIAAALVSLAIKGETFEELAGIAEAMRNRARPLQSRHKRFIDTAGTGSSAAKTFQHFNSGGFCDCRCRSARSETWIAGGNVAMRQRRRAPGARSQHSRSGRDCGTLPQRA